MRQGILLTGLALLAACHPPMVTSESPPSQGPGPEGRTRIGNGGMDDALKDNAWFVADRMIRLCMENGSDLDDSQVEQAIEGAFFTWKKYLAQKKTNSADFHPERAALPPNRRLHTNYQWTSCTDAPDLRVVVGQTGDAQLNWERLHEFPGRSAFAIRREFDVKAGWGRGVIWIASPDRLPKADRTELGKRLWVEAHAVHELGHVLGCGHVPHTLMAEDFVVPLRRSIQRVAESPRPDWERTLRLDTHPDQKRELLTCVDCGFTSNGAMHFSHWDAFDALFGSDKVNEVAPHYQLTATQSEGPGPLVLHFSSADPAWKETVPLGGIQLKNVERGDIPLFKVAFARDNTVEAVASFQTKHEYDATLTGQAYEEPIVMELSVVRNGPFGPLSIGLKDRRDPWLVVQKLEPPEEQK